MENENKTLEEIAELDKRSAELVEELNEQAKEDLANAKPIEYAIDKEDVAVVLTAKARSEEIVASMEEKFDETMERISSDIKKFERLSTFMKGGIASNAVTCPEFAKELEVQYNQIIKNLDNLVKNKEGYINKLNAFKEAIEIFTFKINEEGKAFVEPYAITLAKILLA